MSIERDYIRKFRKKNENRILDQDTLVFQIFDSEALISKLFRYDRDFAEINKHLKMQTSNFYMIEEPEGDVYDALRIVSSKASSSGFLIPCEKEESDVALNSLAYENSELFKLLKNNSRSLARKIYVESTAQDLNGIYGGYYKIKEIDAEDKEFLGTHKNPRRTTWGEPSYSKKTHPFVFSLLEFLVAHELDEQTIFRRAFASDPESMNNSWYGSFDYNKNSNILTISSGSLNLDWAEDHPEEALKKMYFRNKNALKEKFGEFEKFLEIFNAKKNTKYTPRVFSFSVDLRKHKKSDDEIRKEIYSALEKLEHKYDFITDTIQGYGTYSSDSSEETRLVTLVFKTRMNKAKFNQVIGELSNLLPDYEIEDTGLKSYYIN